jgi:pyrroloquinoline quinone biosynthesis protein B
MQVILLGTAAGGGFPQWNCWCPTCRVARNDPARAIPRSQSSAAVSADGVHWFLLNASPDVREQVQHLNGHAPPGARHVPIEGVVLTDAEIDHSLGLVLLREGRSLRVYATNQVEAMLDGDSHFLRTARAFADIEVTTLRPGASTPLRLRSGSASGLAVTPFIVAAGPPRFATHEEPGHTVGLEVAGPDGRRLMYAPGAGALEDALLARMTGAHLVLFDGTFWADSELIDLGIGDRTARQLDHVPVTGPDGSLLRLAATGARCVYVHINNTNPMLIEGSPERRSVEAAGLTVGQDGMRFEI